MIYIHIPFCKQKCTYCNFHFSTSLKHKDEMLAAIKKELILRKSELSSTSLSTLYLGGGTPSILSVDELKKLFDFILKHFSFNAGIEVTLEANPDDLDLHFLKNLNQTPVNRLSVGTQSFFDKDLLVMNRAHHAAQAEDSIKRAQDQGFENLSIDLMYGSPSSDFEVWKFNLQKAVDLQVPHISSYALTVEPKTVLEHWIAKGKVNAPDEIVQNEEFFYMSNFLRNSGFDHYEISNFGKPGFHSKHNTKYWRYKEYLGIGPSAHSYDGHRKRSWNVANNALYCKELENGKLPLETELLSEKDRWNEMLMIGLRTMWGVDSELLHSFFSSELKEEGQKLIHTKIKEGKLVSENGFLKIPAEHWFFADGIASELFLL